MTTTTSYISTSSEGTTAKRNSKNSGFRFAVWVGNSEENAARNWWLAGQKTFELRCANWCGSFDLALRKHEQNLRNGWRSEIQPAAKATGTKA